MKKLEIKQAEPILADLAGKERLFCFNAWANAEIEEQFGGLEKWGNAVQTGDTSDKIEAIAQMGEILMEAGRRWCDFRGEPPRDVMTSDTITALLGVQGLSDLLKVEYEAVVAGRRRTVGAEPSKNAATTPGDM